MLQGLRLVASLSLIATALVAGASPAAAASDPIGAVDSASVRIGCAWEVFGWAMDPDNGSPVELRFLVDGVETNTGGNVFYEPRPDVKAAYPNSTHNPGFTAHVPTGCQARQICVLALNSAGTPGNDRLVGCIALASNSVPEDPVGHVDVVAPEPGRIVVNGWVADRDGEPSSATAVQVHVDGHAVLWNLRTNRPRPDVVAAHPWSVREAGFDQVFPVLPGRHQVCAYAVNIGRRGNNNTTIGCAVVDVPVSTSGTRPPTGRFDEVVARNIQTNTHEEHARGWAFDPDAPGPLTVRVTTLGGFLGNPDVVTDIVMATDVAREDVQRAFPGAGPNQGWDIGPILAGRWVAPRLTCAAATDAGAGARGERLLGCFERIQHPDFSVTLRQHNF